MKQQQFEKSHQHNWHNFAELLKQNKLSKQSWLRKKISKKKLTEEQNEQNTVQSQFTHDYNYQFINLYRMTCQHYALAQQRHYSPQLVNYLHTLVIEGHQQLYSKQGSMGDTIYQFFAYSFPNEFRKHRGLFYISFLTFTLPLAIMLIACYANSEMIYSLMSAMQVHDMEQMYDPNNPIFGRDSDRQSDTDLMMFGHYIGNNIGIDFQIYGAGLFAGIGTLLSILYNGLMIGGVAGHLTGIGYGEKFWAFVVGHGSFELTAVVISGMAGLRLAQSLFMPNNYNRFDAFKIAGQQSIILLMGAGSMTFIAAFIEAFWSSSSLIPDIVKYIVAVLLWGLVIGYLALAGKGREEGQQGGHDR